MFNDVHDISARPVHGKILWTDTLSANTCSLQCTFSLDTISAMDDGWSIRRPNCIVSRWTLTSLSLLCLKFGGKSHPCHMDVASVLWKGCPLDISALYAIQFCVQFATMTPVIFLVRSVEGIPVCWWSQIPWTFRNETSRANPAGNPPAMLAVSPHQIGTGSATQDAENESGHIISLQMAGGHRHFVGWFGCFVLVASCMLAKQPLRCPAWCHQPNYWHLPILSNRNQIIYGN